MKQRERTALAILRSGGSFDEAAESAGIPVARVMEIWDGWTGVAAKLNWQPIETAPRDGTWVLLYFPADENKERPAICVAAHYDADYGGTIGAPPIEAWRGPYSDGFDTKVSNLGVFTHWAPMPDGPR